VHRSFFSGYLRYHLGNISFFEQSVLIPSLHSSWASSSKQRRTVIILYPAIYGQHVHLHRIHFIAFGDIQFPAELLESPKCRQNAQ